MTDLPPDFFNRPLAEVDPEIARLHEIGVTVSRNAVPFDPWPPAVSSGLRVGTPARADRVSAIADRHPLYAHLGEHALT